MFDDDSIHFWKYSIGSTYPDDTPEEKLSFLKSLNAEQLNDLQAIEESLDVLQEFRSDAVVAPGANSKERSELKFPEKVTLAWLWHNVPYSFWISVCTGMFAAFSIGVTIGQTTLAQEWFGKKSISPPLIQPALSNEEVKSKLDQLIQGHNVRRQKLTEAIINEQHDASLFSTGYQERQKAIVDLHKDLENEDATYQSDVKALVDNSLKSNK